jgi:hypothetical protein
MLLSLSFVKFFNLVPDEISMLGVKPSRVCCMNAIITSSASMPEMRWCSDNATMIATAATLPNTDSLKYIWIKRGLLNLYYDNIKIVMKLII